MTHWDLTIPSYAKINLGLSVLGKRPDGYHNIHTIFQELEFHDTLYFRKHQAPVKITTDHASLPVGKKNLVWQAVRIVQQHTGCSDQVAIHLEKRIPIGAGLGGGSSNAAAVLSGMNHLFQLGLSHNELVELGSQLGSDVPFFLYGGMALATGKGEQIQPLADLSPAWVVLVNPGIHVSSGWAYKNVNLKLTNSEEIISVLQNVDNQGITGMKHALLQNVLEGPVSQKYPVIQAIKAQLLEQGAEWAMMSGSGSTVFGIFSDNASAENTRQKMERPGWLAVVTRTKQRKP